MMKSAEIFLSIFFFLKNGGVYFRIYLELHLMCMEPLQSVKHKIEICDFFAEQEKHVDKWEGYKERITNEEPLGMMSAYYLDCGVIS